MAFLEQVLHRSRYFEHVTASIEAESLDAEGKLAKLLFLATGQVGGGNQEAVIKRRETGQVVKESGLQITWNQGLFNTLFNPRLTFFDINAQPINTPEELAAALRLPQDENFDLAAFTLRSLWQIGQYAQGPVIPAGVFRSIDHILNPSGETYLSRVIVNPKTNEREVYYLYMDPDPLGNKYGVRRFPEGQGVVPSRGDLEVPQPAQAGRRATIFA